MLCDEAVRCPTFVILIGPLEPGASAFYHHAESPNTTKGPETKQHNGEVLAYRGSARFMREACGLLGGQDDIYD